MGNIVHKACEVIGLRKKAAQDGKKFYDDKDFGRIFDKTTSGQIMNMAFNHYKDNEPHLNLTNEELLACTKWFDTVLNSEYNPANLKIVDAERYFEFDLNEPRFKYDFVYGDKEYKGFLRVRGTIDLVVDNGDGIYEIVDLKTGSNMNWATRRKKGFKDLQNDFQLKLYYWAARKVYPEAKQILVTINFINSGGATTISFSDNEVEAVENELYHHMQEVKNRNHIVLNTLACSFCPFYKETHKEDPSKTICEFYQDRIKKTGMTNTIVKYGKLDQAAYVGGGTTK